MDLDGACGLEDALVRNGYVADLERLKSARLRYLRDRNRIAVANLPLVHRIAPHYARSNVPAGDLVQEASIGLLRAIDRFDVSRGNRFAAYGVWWIRQSCGRIVEDLDRTIRLPVYLVEILKRVDSVRLRLSARLGRQPSAVELAEAGGFTQDLLRRLELLAGWVESIDDHRIGLATRLIALDEEDAFESSVARQRSIVIENALACLDDRSAEVLRRRFGLGDGNDETLEEHANA